MVTLFIKQKLHDPLILEGYLCRQTHRKKLAYICHLILIFALALVSEENEAHTV